MALIWNVDSFNLTDNWASYNERLQQIAVNEIPDWKHVTVFPCVIIAEMYDLLRTLTAPNKPA